MSISKRISDLRLRQGLKQSDIAAALGWSQSSYSRIETKPQNMTIEELGKIAGVLGVSMVELLTGEGQKEGESEELEKLRKYNIQLEIMNAYYFSIIQESFFTTAHTIRTLVKKYLEKDTENLNKWFKPSFFQYLKTLLSNDVLWKRIATNHFNQEEIETIYKMYRDGLFEIRDSE